MVRGVGQCVQFNLEGMKIDVQVRCYRGHGTALYLWQLTTGLKVKRPSPSVASLLFLGAS